MEFKSFSKAELFMINIHELRKIGQMVGVKSPSSKNKDELVDAIFAIVSGEKEPNVKKDNRGRPSNNVDLVSFSDMFNSKGARVASQTISGYDPLSPKITYEKGIFVLDHGIGRIRKYAFVPSTDDPFVSAGFIVDYGLRDFDVVEYLLANKTSIMKDVARIFSVNGKSVSGEEILFNRLDKGPAKTSFCLNVEDKKFSIKKGGRTIVYSSVTFEGTSCGDAISYSLAKSGKNVVVKLNIDKEDVKTEPADNIKVFSSFVVDNPIKVQEQIELAFKEAKRHVVAGKNVYLVIDGLEAWWLSLQTDNKETALTNIKRMLFLAGLYENGASLSLICLTNGQLERQQNEVIGYFNTKC